jgi:hypothetical protein
MLTTAVVLFFVALAFQGLVLLYLAFKGEPVRPTIRSFPFFLLFAACVATAIHVAQKIPEDVFSAILKVLSNFGG